MLALVVLAMSPDFAALNKENLGEQHRAADLAKQGKYDEAAKLLEVWQPKLRKKLEGKTPAELKANYFDSTEKRLADVIARTKQRAEWAAKAGSDAAAAKKLLVDLFTEPLELRGAEIAPLDASDARVQALLGHLRKLDPEAKKLLAPRKVRVVVKGLPEPLRAEYAKALVASLARLGLAASEKAGDETFEVTASASDEVVDPLVGDDAATCKLTSAATWKPLKVELTDEGYGDAEIEGACMKSRIRDSARHAPRQVLRAAWKF
jgi:hypothetical protein